MLSHRFRFVLLCVSLAWFVGICVGCTQQVQDSKLPPSTHPPAWLGNRENFTDANSACQSLADFRGAKLVKVELQYRYGVKENGVSGAWCDMEGTAIDGETTFVSCPYVGGIGSYVYVGGVKGICVLPTALEEYQNNLERKRKVAIAIISIVTVIVAVLTRGKISPKIAQARTAASRVRFNRRDASPSQSTFRNTTTYADRSAARQALSGNQQIAANRFFKSATGKSQDFKITSIGNGNQRLEFFSPANESGYGKRYVQEIDINGNMFQKYKDTIGPKGLIERKWMRRNTSGGLQ